jgi:hypothetical protein
VPAGRRAPRRLRRHVRLARKPQAPCPPTVTLEAPRDPSRVSSFLNIRVKDIEAVYAEWSARGAQFLTPPKQHEDEAVSSMQRYVQSFK